MNLEQIARKYQINPNTLNAKDDGLKIAVESIKDLVSEMERKNVETSLVSKVKKLGEFINDVSTSSIA